MADEKVSILGKQIGKFAIVGVLNTLIDLLVLNLLVKVTHFDNQIFIFGFPLLMANIVSVTIAMVNSYFWNKYWTFKSKEKKDLVQEIIKFFFITIIGMYIINQFVFNLLYSFWLWPGNIAINLVHLVGIKNLDNFISLNFAKGLAILASLVWNFIFYKIWVFKENE